MDHHVLQGAAIFAQGKSHGTKAGFLEFQDVRQAARHFLYFKGVGSLGWNLQHLRQKPPAALHVHGRGGIGIAVDHTGGCNFKVDSDGNGHLGIRRETREAGNDLLAFLDNVLSDEIGAVA